MSNRTYVWDPLVRILHWTLVAAFATSYLTGEEESLVHTWSGYLVLAVVILRLVWGFNGTHYARFTQFVRSPMAAIGYIKGLVSGRSTYYTGHNPAGGWMTLLLLASLLLTGLSGLKVYGLEGHGPLAVAASPETTVVTANGIEESGPRDGDSDSDTDAGQHADSGGAYGEDFWEEIHEFLANFTVILVLVHIAGVLASSWRHRQNLPFAMITGYKEKNQDRN